MQGGETMKIAKLLYMPQSFRNLLRVSRLVSKGVTMGATQETMTSECYS